MIDGEGTEMPCPSRHESPVVIHVSPLPGAKR
jgi:hypothetical protein